MAGDVTEERDRYIRRLCRSSVVAIVISLVCVLVGCLSIAESAPTYLFPYCLGGSAISGFFVMALAACNIRLYMNYVNNDRTHEDEATIKSWVCRQILLHSLTGIFLMVGLGMSGIWGMVQATDVINYESKFNVTTTKDVPYAKDNLVYAICSFVFVLVLSIVQTSVWCICLCYTDTYGFTDNTNYSRRSGQSYYPRPRAYNASTAVSRAYHGTTTGMTTNEHRPSSQAVAQYTSDRNRNSDSRELRVNIPSFNEGNRAAPSAPPVSRDFQDNRLSTFRGSPVNEFTGSTSHGTDPTRDTQPPPPYDQVSEEPPPSYSQVMTEGAFKVTIV